MNPVPFLKAAASLVACLSLLILPFPSYSLGLSLSLFEMAASLALRETGLPDGYSQIFRWYLFGPSGLKDYGLWLRYAALQNLISSFP